MQPSLLFTFFPQAKLIPVKKSNKRINQTKHNKQPPAPQVQQNSCVVTSSKYIFKSYSILECVVQCTEDLFEGLPPPQSAVEIKI